MYYLLSYFLFTLLATFSFAELVIDLSFETVWIASTPVLFNITPSEAISGDTTFKFSYEASPETTKYWFEADVLDHFAPYEYNLLHPDTALCYIDKTIPVGKILRLQNANSFELHITRTVPTGYMVTCKARILQNESTTPSIPLQIISISAANPSTQVEVPCSLFQPVSVQKVIPPAEIRVTQLKIIPGFSFLPHFDSLFFNLENLTPNIWAKLYLGYASIAEKDVPSILTDSTKYRTNDAIQKELNLFLSSFKLNLDAPFIFNCAKDVRLFAPPNNPLELLLLVGDNPPNETGVTCSIPINKQILIKHEFLDQTSHLGLTFDTTLLVGVFIENMAFGSINTKTIINFSNYRMMVASQTKIDDTHANDLENPYLELSQTIRAFIPSDRDVTLEIHSMEGANMPILLAQLLEKHFFSCSKYINIPYTNSPTDEEANIPQSIPLQFTSPNTNFIADIEVLFDFVEIILCMRLPPKASPTPEKPLPLYDPIVMFYELAREFSGSMKAAPRFTYQPESAIYSIIENKFLQVEFTLSHNHIQTPNNFDTSQPSYNNVAVHPKLIGQELRDITDPLTNCTVVHFNQFDVENPPYFLGFDTQSLLCSTRRIGECRGDAKWITEDEKSVPTFVVSQDSIHHPFASLNSHPHFFTAILNDIDPSRIGESSISSENNIDMLYSLIRGYFKPGDYVRVTCQLHLNEGPKLPLGDEMGIYIDIMSRFALESERIEPKDIDRSQFDKEYEQQTYPWKLIPTFEAGAVRLNVNIENGFYVDRYTAAEKAVAFLATVQKIFHMLQTQLLYSTPDGIKEVDPSQNPFSTLAITDLLIDTHHLKSTSSFMETRGPWGNSFDDIHRITALTHPHAMVSFYVSFAKFPTPILNTLSNYFVRYVEQDPCDTSLPSCTKAVRIVLELDYAIRLQNCTAIEQDLKFSTNKWTQGQYPSCLSSIGQLCWSDTQCAKSEQFGEIICSDGLCKIPQHANSVQDYLAKETITATLAQQNIGAPYIDSLQYVRERIQLIGSPVNNVGRNALLYGQIQCGFQLCNPIWYSQEFTLDVKLPCDYLPPAGKKASSLDIIVQFFDRNYTPTYATGNPNDRRLYLTLDADKEDPTLFRTSAGIKFNFERFSGNDDFIYFSIIFKQLGFSPDCPTGSRIQTYFSVGAQTAIGYSPIIYPLVPAQRAAEIKSKGQFLIGDEPIVCPLEDPECWKIDDDVVPPFKPGQFCVTLFFGDLIPRLSSTSYLRLLPAGLAQATGVKNHLPSLRCVLFNTILGTPEVGYDTTTNSAYLEWSMASLPLNFEQGSTSLSCTLTFSSDNILAYQAMNKILYSSDFGFAALIYDRGCPDSQPDLTCSRFFLSSVPNNDLNIIVANNINVTRDYIPIPVPLAHYFLSFVPIRLEFIGQITPVMKTLYRHVYISVYDYNDPRLPSQKPIGNPQTLQDKALKDLRLVSTGVYINSSSQTPGTQAGIYTVTCLVETDSFDQTAYFPVLQGYLNLTNRYSNQHDASTVYFDPNNEQNLVSKFPAGIICSSYRLFTHFTLYADQRPTGKEAAPAVVTTLELTQQIQDPKDLEFNQDQFKYENYTEYYQTIHTPHITKDCRLTDHIPKTNTKCLTTIQYSFPDTLEKTVETQHYSRFGKHFQLGFELLVDLSQPPSNSKIPIHLGIELSLFSLFWQFFVHLDGNAVVQELADGEQAIIHIGGNNDSTAFDDISYAYSTHLHTECFVNGRAASAVVKHPNMFAIVHQFEYGTGYQYHIRCPQLRLGVIPLIALHPETLINNPLLGVSIVDSGYHDYVDISPPVSSEQNKSSKSTALIVVFSVLGAILGIVIIILVILFLLWRTRSLESIWPSLADTIDDHYYQQFYPEIAQSVASNSIQIDNDASSQTPSYLHTIPPSSSLSPGESDFLESENEVRYMELSSSNSRIN